MQFAVLLSIISRYSKNAKLLTSLECKYFALQHVRISMAPKRKAAGSKKKVETEKEHTEDVMEEELPSKSNKSKSKREIKLKQKNVEEGSPEEPTQNEAEKDIHEEPEPKRARKKNDAPTETAGKTLQNQTTTDYTDVSFGCSRKNVLGKNFNMKISSWNVDGLRAWLKKNGQAYIFKENPDILCLQETKCADNKLPEEIKNVENYKSYWCASEKDGYAGVAVLSKIEPMSVKYGIDASEHDDEGRCITLELKQFYLVNVYVPNAGRKLVTLPKRLSWNEAFKSFIQKLDKKKPVIITGDMNVAHSEIDLANPKTNTKNAGFTKEERKGMTDFLGAGYIDTFRKLYPDKTAAYTFWSYMSKARAKNVGWRLDYFIVSERLMDHVCDNVIRSEVFGSDHCPITLFLNI